MRVRDRELLKRLMVTQRKTERALAAEVGCSPAMIGHFKRGKAGGDVTCTPRTATLVAAALGVPTDVLFVTNVTRDASQKSTRGAA